MMRVLVTGSGGFIGGAIARRLSLRPDLEVIRADRGRLDLADQAGLRAGLVELAPDVVVNAAGRTSGDPASLLADNAIAAANLAATLGTAAPGAGLVQLGSAAQYGLVLSDRPLREDGPYLPQSAYGISKQAAETCVFAQARHAGLRVAALRIFNVVAAEPSGEQAFAVFLRRAAAAMSAGPLPRTVSMGPLAAVRDFIGLDDVVRAVEATIDRGAWGEAINVCSGIGRPVRDLLQAVAAELGELEIVEDAKVEAGARWSVGDPTRCEARLGFRPSADLAPVVRAAADWARREAKADARSRA